MATYLQGVTDYIPQFQPFQPDLNFYANLMQTKQSQYDNNWKALNKVYGQYFYADLTREPNIKKKDELLKQIEFNLKRVSGLDLSLEQNVNQATQVFKPFYEDKNLMKDMAWTKTFNREVGRATSLKGSIKEDDRKQFWDTGLRELNYRKDEFKEVSEQEAMGFQNVSYTPYVNTMEKALKIAKDAGISIESVKFSPDNRWIITQKNGQQLIEPLEKLFESTLGSDPMVQGVYKTQAYVNRKDYAFSNAAEFNGDKNAAEMKYLENSYSILKRQNEAVYKNYKRNSDSYDAKIKALEKDIADKKAPVNAEDTLENLKFNQKINNDALGRIEKEAEMYSNSNSTSVTASGFSNPYKDISTLRYKVDAGMASTLMQKDLGEAAKIYAYRDTKTSVKENPYKVLEIKQANEMQQIHTSGAYKLRTQAMANESREKVNATKIAADKQKQIDQWRLDNGTHVIKEVPVIGADGKQIKGPDGKPITSPEIVANERTSTIKQKSNTSGNVADPDAPGVQMEFEKQQRDEQYKKAQVDDATKQMFSILSNTDKTGIGNKMSPKDLAYVFAPEQADYDRVKKQAASGDISSRISRVLSGEYLNDFANKQMNMISGSVQGTVGRENEVVKGYQEKGVAYFKELSDKYGESYISGAVQRFQEIMNQNAGVSTEFDRARKSMQPYVDPIANLGKYENAFEDYRTEYNQVVKDAIATKYKYNSVNSKGELISTLPEFLEANPGLADNLDYIDENGNVTMDAPNSQENVRGENEFDLFMRLRNDVQTGKIKTKLPTPPSATNAFEGGTNNLAAATMNYIYVNQKGYGTQGRDYYDELVRNSLGTDWDGASNILTYGGLTKDAMDKAKDIGTQQKLFAVFNDFTTQFNDPTSKMPEIEIGGSHIAGNSVNKEGSYIKIPKEFLDKYYNATDPTKGYLSKDEYNGLVTNGISMITNSGSDLSGLTSGPMVTPLQAALNYTGKVEFQDPIDGHTLSIEKSQFKGGASPYDINSVMMHYDPIQGKNVPVPFANVNMPDSYESVDQIYEVTKQVWDQVTEQNKMIKYETQGYMTNQENPFQ